MENNRELGSEFSLDSNCLNIKHNNLLEFLSGYSYTLFDSGRSAIKNVPIDRNKFVLLPEYLCESVIKSFPAHKIIFYKIKSNLEIDLNDLMSKIDNKVGTILFVNYFGYIQSELITNSIKLKAKRYGITVIEDNTQSLLSKHSIVGDYAVASIRKWIPIPNGGVLYSNKHNIKDALSGRNFENSIDNRKINALILKHLFLNEGLDVNLEYRKIFAECEEAFENSNPKYISDLSEFIIKCFDCDVIIEKRKQNYRILEKLLFDLDIVPIRELMDNECPLVLPIRIKQRNSFKSYLMDNKVYCAVHWPFDGFKSDDRKMAIHNSETLISLPIDQRYNEEDMLYLAYIIKKYVGR